MKSVLMFSLGVFAFFPAAAIAETCVRGAISSPESEFGSLQAIADHGRAESPEEEALREFAEMAVKYHAHTSELIETVLDQAELEKALKYVTKKGFSVEKSGFFLGGFLDAWMSNIDPESVDEIQAEIERIQTLDQFVEVLFKRSGFNFSEKHANEVSANAGTPKKGACAAPTESSSALEKLTLLTACVSERI